MEVLQGTLDLMVLQTLDSMGPMHGYGLARRIEQISEEILKLNEGNTLNEYMQKRRLRPDSRKPRWWRPARRPGRHGESRRAGSHPDGLSDHHGCCPGLARLPFAGFSGPRIR